MGNKQKRMGMRNKTTFLGIAVLLAVTLFVLGGCASTGDGPMAMARQIHSMTPCGMMMGAMMGDGHGSDHGNESVHDQVESYISSQQADYAKSEADHLHSPSPDPK